MILAKDWVYLLYLTSRPYLGIMFFSYVLRELKPSYINNRFIYLAGKYLIALVSQKTVCHGCILRGVRVHSITWEFLCQVVLTEVSLFVNYEDKICRYADFLVAERIGFTITESTVEGLHIRGEEISDFSETCYFELMGLSF